MSVPHSLSLAPLVVLLLAAQTASDADARLQRRLPEVHLHGVALADAVDFLRDVSGANFFVDWAALKGANVTKDHPITLDAQNVMVAQCLEQVLHQVSPDVTYRGRDGV